MGMKARQNATDSPKAEVGEIDTRAPFESVKAAVSLFGEVAFSADKSTPKKPKPPLTERTFAKETQLHLVQKELNKFKEQLNNAEATRIQALAELEIAKNTVEDLTHKLNTINESKELALQATEAAKTQTKQLEEVSSNDRMGNDGAWKQELDGAREQYAVAITELNAAKQDLIRIRKDFEASMDAKTFAVRQEAEAKLLSGSNTEKAAQLSKEITAAQESMMHVKLAIEQAQQEESKVISDKAASRLSYKQALEDTQKKLASLKKEFDPKLNKNLEAKLAETTAEIGAVQKEMENARASDSELIATVTAELDSAKDVLLKFAEEETTLQSLVECLKVELEALRKEHNELKEKDAETESIVGSLHVKLRKSKADLEAAMAAESKATSASSELISTLQQLSTESENALREAEAMKKNAEELRNEAEASRLALDEAEKNLQVALKEAEEAKADEAKTLDKIKELSEKANIARASTSESGAKITISKEEYESLSRKVEESEKLADMKVAAAMAQVEAVRASENEAINRLEASRKEMEEIEIAMAEALKRSEMAEAAKTAVEGELRRWREREQKKVAEAAARILAETQEMSVEASPPRTRASKTSLLEMTQGERQVSRAPTAKKTLLPNLSGIFHRKKNQVDGASVSYLPGEKPVKAGQAAGDGESKGWSFEGGLDAYGVAQGHQQLGLKILTRDEELKTSQVITRAAISNYKKIGFSLS